MDLLEVDLLEADLLEVDLLEAALLEVDLLEAEVLWVSIRMCRFGCVDSEVLVAECSPLERDLTRGSGGTPKTKISNLTRGKWLSIIGQEIAAHVVHVYCRLSTTDNTNQ